MQLHPNFFVTKIKSKHIIVTKKYRVGDSRLSSKFKKIKSNLGWIIGSIGVGIVITFIIPIWGWIIAVGAGLIYIGWYIISCNR